MLCLSFCLLGIFPAKATEIGYYVQGPGKAAEIGNYVQGYTLPNAPDYAWWYGCSPTSAGMMMGYYDINGYKGSSYGNLVPGGTAELSTYGNPGALVNNIIASAGDIADFYKTPPGYGGSGDDNPAPWHAFNSLADFMGTSQDPRRQ